MLHRFLATAFIVDVLNAKFHQNLLSSYMRPHHNTWFPGLLRSC